MCGRVAVFRPLDAIAEYFAARDAADLQASYQPSYNVAPSRPVVGLVETHHSERVLGAYRWGLVPPSSADPSVGNRFFNARCEGLRSSPAFGPATTSRRLAIVVDGFFEWQHEEGRRGQPSFFHRADGDPLALAGVWESWRDPVGDHRLLTCTMITTAAGADVVAIHDRMPVVLESGGLDAWLHPTALHHKDLDRLLRPAPSGTLAHHPVGMRVGNVHNDSPELIAPVPPDEDGSREPQLRLFG